MVGGMTVAVSVAVFSMLLALVMVVMVVGLCAFCKLSGRRKRFELPRDSPQGAERNSVPIRQPHDDVDAEEGRAPASVDCSIAEPGEEATVDQSIVCSDRPNTSAGTSSPVYSLGASCTIAEASSQKSVNVYDRRAWQKDNRRRSEQSSRSSASREGQRNSEGIDADVNLQELAKTTAMNGLSSTQMADGGGASSSTSQVSRDEENPHPSTPAAACAGTERRKRACFPGLHCRCRRCSDEEEADVGVPAGADRTGGQGGYRCRQCRKTTMDCFCVLNESVSDTNTVGSLDRVSNPSPTPSPEHTEERLANSPDLATAYHRAQPKQSHSEELFQVEAQKEDQASPAHGVSSGHQGIRTVDSNSPHGQSASPATACNHISCPEEKHAFCHSTSNRSNSDDQQTTCSVTITKDKMLFSKADDTPGDTDDNLAGLADSPLTASFPSHFFEVRTASPTNGTKGSNPSNSVAMTLLGDTASSDTVAEDEEILDHEGDKSSRVVTPSTPRSSGSGSPTSPNSRELFQSGRSGTWTDEEIEQVDGDSVNPAPLSHPSPLKSANYFYVP